METQEVIEKIERLLRHIDAVQSSCRLLGRRLIQTDRVDLGKSLIANSLKHDNSKFFGMEWDNLINGPANEDHIKMVVNHHRSVNEHHPHYWGGIENMPEVYLAELVCDLHARSAEQGTDLRGYVRDKFMPLHNIPPSGKVYKSLKMFIDMLLDDPLKTI